MALMPIKKAMFTCIIILLNGMAMAIQFTTATDLQQLLGTDFHVSRQRYAEVGGGTRWSKDLRIAKKGKWWFFTIWWNIATFVSNKNLVVVREPYYLDMIPLEGKYAVKVVIDEDYYSGNY